MAAGTKDIGLEQGASYRMVMTWTQNSGLVDEETGLPIPGDPYDLNGARAHMQIRNKPGGTVLVDLTTENGGIVLGTDGDGTTGKIAVYVSPVQTESITIKKASYDLFIVFPGEFDSIRILKGKVTIAFTVTNDGDGAP